MKKPHVFWLLIAVVIALGFGCVGLITSIIYEFGGGTIAGLGMGISFCILILYFNSNESGK